MRKSEGKYSRTQAGMSPPSSLPPSSSSSAFSSSDPGSSSASVSGAALGSSSYRSLTFFGFSLIPLPPGLKLPRSRNPGFDLRHRFPRRGRGGSARRVREVVGRAVDLHRHVVAARPDLLRLRAEVRVVDEDARGLPVGEVEHRAHVEHDVGLLPARPLDDGLLHVEPCLVVQLQRAGELHAVVDLVVAVGGLPEEPLFLQFELGPELEVLGVRQGVLQGAARDPENLDLLAFDARRDGCHSLTSRTQPTIPFLTQEEWVRKSDLPKTTLARRLN